MSFSKYSKTHVLPLQLYVDHNRKINKTRAKKKIAELNR